MTVYWVGDDGLETITGGTRSAVNWNNPVMVESWGFGRPERSLMARILDELSVMIARAKGPPAILIAAIRDQLRCMPRLVPALPDSQCISRIVRRPRRRDVHHGAVLLNFHRMPG